MKKKILTAVVLGLSLTLSACVSLAPKENTNTNTKTEQTSNIKTVSTEISETRKEIENMEKVTLPEFNLESFKRNIRFEVLNQYNTHKDNFALERHNTIFSSRPNRSVYVLNFTGDPHAATSFLDIKGTIEGKPVMFDYNTFHGNINGELFILEFMEPITKEEFDNIQFSVDIATDKGDVSVNVPVSYKVEKSKLMPVPGSPFNITEDYMGLWKKNSHVEKQGELDKGYIYGATAELSVFGKNINLKPEDIKASINIDGVDTEIPSDRIIVVNDELKNSPNITKTSVLKVELLEEISFDDAQNKKVEFRIKVKDSYPLILDINSR